MVTTIQGRTNAVGFGELEFKADRDYDVYALAGYNLSDLGRIRLTYGTELSAITLKQGVTNAAGGGIYWTGHLILRNGDSLVMIAAQSGDESLIIFNILLVPRVIAKAAEIVAEKEAEEWLKW